MGGGHRWAKTVPGVVVRDASKDDLPLVRTLSMASLSRFGEYDLFLEDLLRSGMTTRTAEWDGRPVGFAILVRRKEAADAFELVAIVVEEAARRRGVGRALLLDAHRRALAADEAADRVRITLHVAEVNVPARNLFESAGYRLAAEEDAWYPEGQRALAMERWLVRGEPAA